MSEIKKIKVAGVEYGIADEVNREELQNLNTTVNQKLNGVNTAIEGNTVKITAEMNRAKGVENEIKSKALHYNTVHTSSTAGKVNIGGKSVDGSNTMSVDIPAATIETAGVMSANDKVKLDNLATLGSSTNLNTYTDEGVFVLSGITNAANFPINTPDNSSFRLTVLSSTSGDNTVVTQVLNLNNNAGGEGNIYIRSQQNGAWGAWGKLQTNVEVGAIGLGQTKTFDDLTDNGIYSGVNVIQTGTDSSGYPITSYETFVLVVINAYLTGGGVTQLKYSLLLDGTTSVMTRAYTDDWSEWEKVGKEYELPIATSNVLGGIKLGSGLKVDNNNRLQLQVGSGVVIDNSSCITLKLGADSGLDINSSSGGLVLKLGTALYINSLQALDLRLGTTTELATYYAPLNFGSALNIEGAPKVLGVAVDKKQFQYGNSGLQLAEDYVKTENVASSVDDSENPVQSKAIAEALAEAVEQGRQLAKRDLYIAAGALYNDTDSPIVRGTPWDDYVDDVEYKALWDIDVLTGTVQSFTYNGTTYEYIDDNGTWKIITRVTVDGVEKYIWDDSKVIHRAGHYYLNGLGDITETQMSIIYAHKFVVNNLDKPRILQSVNIRTIYPLLLNASSYGQIFEPTKLSAISSTSSSIEIFMPTALFFVSTINANIIKLGSVQSVFTNAKRLRVIIPLNIQELSSTLNNTFSGCTQLNFVFLYNAKSSILLADSPLVSKSSILYTIQNASPTSAITITLHADAYTRLAEDADIVAALETKNAELATSGSGSISLVSA